MVRGRHPGRGARPASRLLAARQPAPGRGGGRRRRRDHRRALGRRARPRGRRRWAARSSPPRRSPAPSRATSGCAGARCRLSRPASRAGWSTRRRPADLAAAAASRQADPAFLPRLGVRPGGRPGLAALAVGIALRRHAGRSQVVFGPDGRVVERTRQGPARGRPAGRLGRRAAPRPGRPTSRSGCCGRHLGADAEGWQLPEAPQVVVDRDYVLAAARSARGPTSRLRRRRC